MRVVLQRVSRAMVTIQKETYGSIEKGFLLLVGITQSDDEDIVNKMAAKCAQLRVFEDANGKMNLGLQDIGGAILSISQFTLYADCKRGRRPGFEKAAKPELSKPLYEAFNKALEAQGIHVETGIFGADMKVDFCNDGPVTIILDSDEL